MRIRAVIVVTLFIFLITGCIGCGLWDTAPTTPSIDHALQNNLSSAGGTSSESLSGAAANSTTNARAIQPPPQYQPVEIVWAIPETPVAGYIIRYGSDKTNLEHIIKLKSEMIEKNKDPKYGDTFRYVFENVKTPETFFATVAAYNEKGEESAQSEVMTVR